MMDRTRSAKVTAEGAALASQCTKVAHQLYDIAGRSKEAASSIRSTAKDCEALQLVWTRIGKWFTYWAQVDDALLRWLNPALVIGKMIMSALEHDFYNFKSALESSRYKRRPEAAWNESIVRSHRALLKGQVGDLNILLEAVELKSPSDRDKLLRSKEPLLQVSDNSAWSMVPPRLADPYEDTISVKSATTWKSTDPLIRKSPSSDKESIGSPHSKASDEKSPIYDRPGLPRRTVSLFSQTRQADTWHLDLAIQQDRVDILENILRHWTPDLNEWKNRQLPKACRDGNERLVRCLLKNGADARSRETPDSYLMLGRTALHLAATNGNVEIARSLIGHGASVNEIYTGYRTPLHEAASRGHSALATLLIQKGAPVDACDESRYRPIHAACMAGSYDVVKTLLQNGSNIHSSGNDKYQPIHHAAQDGRNADLITLLATNGADTEAETPFHHRPLQLAAKSESTPVIRALLLAGASPNAGSGEQPLQMVCRAGLPEAAQLLIDAGAALEFGASEGKDTELLTPLGCAVYARQLLIIAKLLAAGADVNACNATGFAPIHMTAMGRSISPTLASVQERRDEALRLLLQHGADCKAKDSRGYQVFHYLADSPNFTAIDALHVRKLTAALLNAGAEINAVNNSGDSPLDIAANNVRSWLAHILVENGARQLKPETLRGLYAKARSPMQETSFDATRTLQYLRGFKITQYRSVTV